MKVSITKTKPFQFAFAAIFWIILWYIAAFAIGSELFLPYPHTTLFAFFSLIGQGLFWKSVANSLCMILLGCLVGCLSGFLLAALSAKFSLAKAVVSPFVTVLRATPVASFIILIYVIVRKIMLPINTVSFLIVIVMVIPIVYHNVYIGLTSFDPKLTEVAKVFHFSFEKKIMILWFPQIRPYLYAGVTNALGLAWKAGVAAEVICNLQNTIGKNLADAKYNLEMDTLFGWTMTVILLSLLFEVSFKKLVNRKHRRRRGNCDLS